MSIPTGDNAFLHELELTVHTELTMAGTGQTEDPADGEWLPDTHAEHYAVRLRTLLSAVEALEESYRGGRAFGVRSLQERGDGSYKPVALE